MFSFRAANHLTLLSMRGAGAIRLIGLLLIVLAVVALIARADFSGSDPQSRYAKQISDTIGKAFGGIFPKPVKRSDVPDSSTAAGIPKEPRDLDAIAKALDRIGSKDHSKEAADVIKYTDSAGQIHYVNSFEKVPEEYRKTVDPQHRLPPLGKVESKRSEDQPVQSAAAAKAKPVEIYVTSWCPYCRKLEQMLKSDGIAYKRYDIEKDRAGAERHKKLGGGGVPLIKIGNEVIRGFSPDVVRAALAK